MAKYKLSKDFSDEVAGRIAESKEFEDKLYDDRLAQLNKIYSGVKDLPNTKISDEAYAKAIADGVDKMLDNITSTHIGKAGGSLMYLALLLATLPISIGQVGTIHWEKKVTRFVRKAERPELLDAVQYINSYYRGLLKLDEMKDKLKLLGLPDDEIAFLMRISEAVPSVQDVITFAVREVYSPQIAERFGQFEGVDDVYDNAKTDLQSVGMSKETFRKYWAAHWGLPSTQMGFEMLHRGVISDSDLDLLLKSADVMPFWRDKIKAISYSPLTRVDVRRMHKMGILDKAGVKQAYKNIGYNDKDAELMTQFTIIYNQNPETAEQTDDDKKKSDYKDLTKADIIRNYQLGIVDRITAKQYLISIGFNEQESEFLLSRQDFIIDEERKDATIKYLQEAYTKGYLDKTTVVQEFGKLSLSSTAQDNYLKLWDLSKSIKIATPSRADIVAFVKAKIITVDTAIAELKKLGYPDIYINWYLKQAKVVTA